MNIQNLFHRDLSFLRQNASKNLQDWMEEFQSLLRNPDKRPRDLTRMRELAFLMGFSPKATEPFLTLRRKGGRLYVKPLGGERQARATERLGWNGWVELRSYPLDEAHRSSKVGCIARANPDILVLQEVEDRPSLSDFNREYLAPKLGGPFQQWLFTEGNDNRGLGHAILTRNGHRIVGFRPHAHEKDLEGRDLFEMDCPEYTIVTPEGEELTIISARFQEDGDQGNPSAKRKEQARSVRSFYDRLNAQGKHWVLVCGTLGEVSYADVLRPLMGDGALRDIPCHVGKAAVHHGQRDWRAFEEPTGDWVAKHDYLLSSHALFQRIRHSQVHFPLPPRGGRSSRSGFPNSGRDRDGSMAPPLVWADFAL